MQPISRELLAALVSCVLVAPAANAQGQWSSIYGGTGTGELVHSVRELASGDIVVAASTDSFGTMTGDGWLIRLDASGNVLSEHVVGNAQPGGVDGAVVLADGGAVFASRNVRDIFTLHEATIVRVDPTGTPLWVTNITAGDGRWFVNDIVALSNGTFLCVGQSAMTDAGPHVGWLTLLAADGSVTWQQYQGGVIGEDLSYESGIETSDGGFAVTGWITSATGGEDVFVAKLTNMGAITWTRRVGGMSADRGAAIAEIRGGGGYAVVGSTDSFTNSGHAGWIIRMDTTGAITWTEAIGDFDWSDLQAITVTSDNDLLVLGRVSAVSNDLWAAKIGQGSASILWQRRYEGIWGDLGSEVVELAGGDLLLAGTWGWGFPEEDVWLLRTDSMGRMPGCFLVHDTTLTNSAPRYTQGTPLLPPYPPLGMDAVGTVVTDTTALTATPICGGSGCAELRCDDVTVDPSPACEGTSQTVTLVTSGGMGAVTVRWDLDGDTTPETVGNPASSTFPFGTTSVRAFAEDECMPMPGTCELSADVRVLSATPPGEVSDVVAGAVPLLVHDHGARLSFEERADAVAYNLHADAIGSWYAPNAAAGSACFVATAPAGAGRVETSPALAANTWVLVTASSRCAEGLPGRDSMGRERIATGTWPTCGPAP